MKLDEAKEILKNAGYIISESTKSVKNDNQMNVDVEIDTND